MNDKWNEIKKELALDLHVRAIVCASCFICCWFGFQFFGVAGGFLGSAAGMIAGLLILVLLDARKAAREEANTAGHGPGKRGYAQDDDLLAFRDLYRASSNDGPKPRR